jgi:hypothetical protein
LIECTEGPANYAPFWRAELVANVEALLKPRKRESQSATANSKWVLAEDQPRNVVGFATRDRRDCEKWSTTKQCVAVWSHCPTQGS